jgi:hypothetical protein
MPRARLAVLLKHSSQIDDDREPWRVANPLAEALLLLTCATIASRDDFDDIVAWGEDHLDFLRRFSASHFGIPCERWLRSLVNRVEPVLFGRCFGQWIAALWPDRIVGAPRSLAVDGNQIVPPAARCCKVDFSAPPLKAEREVIMRRHPKRRYVMPLFQK